MPEAVTLLLVDVQKDFHPGGTLAIPTADEDAKRIAKLITDHGSKIQRIVATMDSHLKLDIAHPGFWVSGKDGETHPGPFTFISSQDIVDGKWKPKNQTMVLAANLIDVDVFGELSDFVDASGKIDLYKYSIEYTRRLEKNGRFQLTVWPEHCLVGKPGHGVVDCVMDALDEWSISTGGSVEWVLKGQNLLTESYSALEAEVPVDKETSFNMKLQKSLEASDRLLVCGQAMSHCVNYTLRSIVSQWPQDKFGNITLLTDCASVVPGFDEAGNTFQKDMADVGVLLKKSSEVF